MFSYFFCHGWMDAVHVCWKTQIQIYGKSGYVFFSNLVNSICYLDGTGKVAIHMLYKVQYLKKSYLPSNFRTNIAISDALPVDMARWCQKP